MTLTFPLPPKCLHPNARSHWKAKMRPKKNYRAEAALIASQARLSEPFKRATVQLTFYLARKQDADNLLAWCKPLFDGLQDGGLIANDSGLTFLPCLQVTGKGLDYRVELTIQGEA